MVGASFAGLTELAELFPTLATPSMALVTPPKTGALDIDPVKPWAIKCAARALEVIKRS